MAVVIIYFMGAADRVSGDTYDLGLTKWSDRVWYGWLIAALFGHYWDAVMVGIVLATALGRAPGWGEPLGAALTGRPMIEDKLEWWQHGICADDTWIALAVRGAMWGLCYVPVAIFDPRLLVLLPAYIIALPAAVAIARYVWGDWEWQERYRGWIAGGITALSLVGS